MKKSLLLLLLASVGFVSCQESMADRAEREAKDYTVKNCPAPVARNLVLDSITFDRNTETLIRYFRLSGFEGREEMIGPETVRQALITELKNATSARDFKEAGFKFRFVYRAQENPEKTYFEVTIGPEEYNN